MKLNMMIHKGSDLKPVVIFIHGLGMDMNFWLDPVNTRVFARNIPMKVFAARKPEPCSAADKTKKITAGITPENINNLWSAVTGKGFNAICWSQRRPVGPISVAVEELTWITRRAEKLFPGKPLVLLCHSRGGLVARKFMEKKHPAITALLTVSSPHHGSSLSRIGSYLAPLDPAIRKLLPGHAHGTVSEVLRRLRDFIEGGALKELLPGSDFFRNLRDSPHGDITYISFGGTTTRLLTVYSWKREDDILYPNALLTVPDSLLRFLPSSIIPKEITPGKGDFMVTAESSVLPWTSRHYNLAANHISITWHKKAINNIIETLEEL